MSYLALARKWRPRTFSQLIGQEHITVALSNALKLKRLHHAYLFTGTRGVGKTSVARILAKALNCETGINSEPCLQCESCVAIEQGRFVDLIEIDGASKTRVEDTRELLDNVPYAPSIGRFKIYLIDEVHMLSQHSFNALLKTLEEPPEHVKFILATTDPQKLPVTILSRCLQFSLRHLAGELIEAHLQNILIEENIETEAAALALIAKAARGSMRDALSLLDQAITSCADKLLSADVKKLLGYTQQDYALPILQALAISDGSQLISISEQIASEGGHFHHVLEELQDYLHQIAVYQCIDGTTPLIAPTAEIKALASNLSAEDVQLFYQIGLRTREDIQLAPSLSIGFKMFLLRMLTFKPAAHIPLPIKNMPVNDGMKVKDCHINTTIESAVKNEPETSTDQKNEDDESEARRDEAWGSIIHKLKLSGLANTALEHAEFVGKEDRTITLRVDKGHLSLFTPTIVERIEDALSKYFQNTIKIILNSDQQTQATPAQQRERATQQKLQTAEEALHNDDVFQQLQQEFSGKLVKNSIVPMTDAL
jgi:DNA polymerase-3 subunit gamma/tau